MTASFSLRLRLKVYSLKMRFATNVTSRSILQRPTVNETLIPSAAGSPSALAFQLLSAVACTPTVLDGLCQLYN
jgi:hypothetical protein